MRRSSAFVDYGATSRQPLRGALKKCALESRLKRAGLGFADSKSGTDFELGSTMDFHVHPAALCQRRAHRVQRQLGRVAIAAEMSEHDALDFSWQQLLDHACRGRVRQMTMP